MTSFPNFQKMLGPVNPGQTARGGARKREIYILLVHIYRATMHIGKLGWKIRLEKLGWKIRLEKLGWENSEYFMLYYKASFTLHTRGRRVNITPPIWPTFLPAVPVHGRSPVALSIQRLLFIKIIGIKIICLPIKSEKSLRLMIHISKTLKIEFPS